MEASVSLWVVNSAKKLQKHASRALGLIAQSSVSSLTFLTVVNLSWCSTVYYVASRLRLQLLVLV